MIRIFLFFFFLFFLGSCYYDSDEELYPGGCDENSISLSITVQPILSQNCMDCHSALQNQGNVNLEGYDQIKIYVDNDRLLGAIKHESGYDAMPQNAPKLDDCSIYYIETWIDEGALNN